LIPILEKLEEKHHGFQRLKIPGSGFRVHGYKAIKPEPGTLNLEPQS
jgi:hypothetical protein